MLASFIASRPPPVLHKLRRPLSPRNAPHPPRRTRPAMQVVPPQHAWRAAAEAAVEDFVKSGMNVCVGHPATAAEIGPLIDALDTHAQVETLVDMAYYATTPETAALLRDRDLPDDPSVNFKASTDLYIAAAPAVDAACNAVLASPDLAAERTAAETADRVVLLVPERSFLSRSTTFATVPVELSAFAPDLSLQRLRDMRDLGVLSVDLRERQPVGPGGDGGADHAQRTAVAAAPRLLADLTLSASAHPQLLAEELRREPFVTGVGILPASARTTVIVAADDGEPFDVTPLTASLAGMPAERRSKALSATRRGDLLKPLDAWRFVAAHPDRLESQFVFRSAGRATAFVRLVQELARQCEYYPTVTHAGAVVDVSVASPGADGVTEMELMVATELTNMHARLGALA